MSECNYKPSGELQGDTKPVPMRGTTTGMTGHPVELDGMSLDMDAINRLGAIGRHTRSDKGDELIDSDRDQGRV